MSDDRYVIRSYQCGSTGDRFRQEVDRQDDDKDFLLALKIDPANGVVSILDVHHKPLLTLDRRDALLLVELLTKAAGELPET